MRVEREKSKTDALSFRMRERNCILTSNGSIELSNLALPARVRGPRLENLNLPTHVFCTKLSRPSSSNFERLNFCLEHNCHVHSPHKRLFPPGLYGCRIAKMAHPNTSTYILSAWARNPPILPFSLFRKRKNNKILFSCLLVCRTHSMQPEGG